MRTYKLVLEYDGSRFSGWQTQNSARTVQGELQQAANELFGTEVDIQGSGAGRTPGSAPSARWRTSKSGSAARNLPDARILRELNDRLPAAIAVLSCEEIHPGLHARHDAVARAYFYQISTRKAALSKRFVWWVKEPLHVARMQAAAALIAGRHDFTCFRAADASRPDESTIVVVNSAEVAIDDHLVIFRIEASHFLWKMVRRLAGVLVKVGLEEITIEQFRDLLCRAQESKKLDVAA